MRGSATYGDHAYHYGADAKDDRVDGNHVQHVAPGFTALEHEVEARV